MIRKTSNLTSQSYRMSLKDAKLIAPIANMTKAIVKTATLGVPLEFNVAPTDLVKNIAAITWRTGFPVTMPKGFMEKAQDFYNRVRLRVQQTSVETLERKSLADLKTDLDNIVDGIVDEIRQSNDGLYTDYLQTRVGGVPLEDACTQVGTQLKAYGIDLTNYQAIAGAVLGIPIMPQVASAVMNVANLAQPIHGTIRNVTGNFVRGPVSQIPMAALGSVSNLHQTALTSANQIVRSAVPSQLTSLLPFGSRQAQPQVAY